MAFTDYLTMDGKMMLAKAAAGYRITVTKMVLGSAMIAASQSPEIMTGVVTPVVELPIDQVIVLGDNSVQISAIFDNSNITEGFYFREKGIYMSDGGSEVLAIYANAGYNAEYIDTGSVLIHKTLRTVMAVTSDEAANITVSYGDYTPRLSDTYDEYEEDGNAEGGLGASQHAVAGAYSTIMHEIEFAPSTAVFSNNDSLVTRTYEDGSQIVVEFSELNGTDIVTERHYNAEGVLKHTYKTTVADSTIQEMEVVQ